MGFYYARMMIEHTSGARAHTNTGARKRIPYTCMLGTRTYICRNMKIMSVSVQQKVKLLYLPREVRNLSLPP